MNKNNTLLFLVIFILLLGGSLFFSGTTVFNKQHLLIFFIGIVSSFVGTLAGGGGLITLPAMMLTGIPIQTSIATNKFSSGVAAFSSIFYLIHHKHFNLKTIIKDLSVAFLGGIGGALFTAHVSEKTMNMIAFILLFFALVVTIRNKGWTNTLRLDNGTKSNKIRELTIPFSIAVYDGGFGPGSATFGILYYMKEKKTYIQAVQLTRVLIFGSCVGAFIIFYQSGFLEWPLAIAMALGSIIGSQIGLIILPKVPLKLARILLISIVCLLMVQITYQII